jgi:hypothetical protein
MAHLNAGPNDAIEHAAAIYSPNAARLVRQHRLNGGPLIIAELLAHDLRLRFRGSAINRYGEIALSLLPLWGHSRNGRTCRCVARVAIDPNRTCREPLLESIRQKGK